MMKVSALRRYLTGLGALLHEQGQLETATELERFLTALDPLGDMRLSELAEQLTRGPAANQVLPESAAEAGTEVTKRTRRKTPDPERVSQALQTVRDLYNRAIEDEVTYDHIRETMDQLKKDLSKDEALALAEQFEIEGKFESKPEAIGAVGKKIELRKSAHERRQLD